MAISYRVASRYAKSLLSLAEEKNVQDAVKHDMGLFIQVVDENYDLHLMLQSPIIYHEKKREILGLIFKGHMHELSFAYFDLISKKNREEALYAIAKEYLNQYNHSKGIQVAELYTAVAVDKSIKKEFSDLVAKAVGKDVQLNEIVEKDLIGGYVLRIDDKQVDASVKSKLQHLKFKFSHN